MSLQHDEVVEVIEGEDHARVLLTCEHASNRLPPPWTWPDDDLWLVDTHWAIDLGIAAITRDLAHAIGAPAVLARFTRLLCDANRPIDAEQSLVHLTGSVPEPVRPPSSVQFRTIADGHPVRLNQALTDEERHRRISRFHSPYHEVADAMLGRYPRAVVLSMHSFTPIYEDGPPRAMEVGVLFDREERISHAIAESLARDGWAVALNEPYSGKEGLIYSAARHAERHNRAALQLEVRQDVALDQRRRPALVASLRHALGHAGVL